jgi:hypothetical protein
MVRSAHVKQTFHLEALSHTCLFVMSHSHPPHTKKRTHKKTVPRARGEKVPPGVERVGAASSVGVKPAASVGVAVLGVIARDQSDLLLLLLRSQDHGRCGCLRLS